VFAAAGICLAVSTSFAVLGHPAASAMQRPHEAAPVGHATVRAKPAVTSPAKARAPTPFEIEQRMSAAALITRWDPEVARASKRFHVPQGWIRAVMEAESGGRTMASETEPIVSNKGAMGLMQLMPETWREWRATLALGTDPYDPHDNITAATAYLHVLYAKYGYPAMFAAYNDGPGNLEQRMIDGGLLPQRVGAKSLARFTRPNGEAVMINGFAVTAVRAPLPDEYPPGVNAVIAMGRLSQGVRETLGQTTRLLRAHGGRV
jgi:soluble lytic murein transglycosylase-like protein